MSEDSIYRVLILGDFHYGESYLRAGARILQQRGYNFSTQHLQPFVAACDTFILNLETPLATEERFPSPLRDEKTYIHWADPDQSGAALAKLGVHAVSLANNHTGDLGHAALEASFDVLAARNIAWFGAGSNREDAERPYTVPLPDSVGGGAINFYGSFQYSRNHDEKFHFYATDTTPGCARISASHVAPPVSDPNHPDMFHIAFPHWGSNYDWRTTGQSRIAQHLIKSGYDLILGHGSHTLQEIHRESDQWTVYGIGNGNFQSGGRWKRFKETNGILPYSFWTVLEVARQGSERTVSIKLYPVYSNNKQTGFQPRPVSSDHFGQVVQELTERAEPRGTFLGEHSDTGSDEYGHFIKLELATWPLRRAPLTLRQERRRVAQAIIPASDEHGATPNTYTDATSQDIITQNVTLGRNLGALAISQAAVRQGANLEWLSKREAWASLHDRRVPIVGHMGTESALAAAIVGDKTLAKELMSRAGVPVPDGRQATSAADAVRAQQEIGRPVVVKPRFGSMGRGVTVNIDDPRHIQQAFTRAHALGDVIVEQYVHGLEYRAHATATECIGAFRRLLPSVTGDGNSTVRELIHRMNEFRNNNPTTRMYPIPMDDVARDFLARQGMNWHSIVPDGRRIVVRDVNGITSGGDSEECFDTVGPDLKDAAVKAVAGIPGMDWGGVDILVEAETGIPYVMEINIDAAINGSTFPVYGTPRDLGQMLWRRMFDRSFPEPIDMADDPTVNIEFSPEIKTEVPGLTNQTVTLQDVLQEELRNRGWTVAQKNRSVWAAQNAYGDAHWFRHAQSAEDSSISVLPLRRRLALRRIMRRMEVPRPVGRRVRTVEQLNEFRDTHGSAVSLLPLRGHRGKELTIIGVDDPVDNAIFQGRAGWFAQVYRSGPRLRVIATPTQVLAIIAPREHTDVSTRSLQRVSTVGIQAVRALPQLRWAVVDLVLRTNRVGRVMPLVEDVTMQPSFHGDDVVVAGSLDSVKDMLLSGSSVH